VTARRRSTQETHYEIETSGCAHTQRHRVCAADETVLAHVRRCEGRCGTRTSSVCEPIPLILAVPFLASRTARALPPSITSNQSPPRVFHRWCRAVGLVLVLSEHPNGADKVGRKPLSFEWVQDDVDGREDIVPRHRHDGDVQFPLLGTSSDIDQPFRRHCSGAGAAVFETRCRSGWDTCIENTTGSSFVSSQSEAWSE
jgi:hypothetical protein